MEKIVENPLVYPMKIWVNAINRIDEIFKNERIERYPEGVLLLTSFIEKCLEFLMACKFATYTKKENHGKFNYKMLSTKFEKWSLFVKIKKSFDFGLIDETTYENLMKFKNNRNKYIHEFFFVPEHADASDFYKLSQKILPILLDKMDYYYDIALIGIQSKSNKN